MLAPQLQLQWLGGVGLSQGQPPATEEVENSPRICGRGERFWLVFFYFKINKNIKKSSLRAVKKPSLRYLIRFANQDNLLAAHISVPDLVPPWQPHWQGTGHPQPGLNIQVLYCTVLYCTVLYCSTLHVLQGNVQEVQCTLKQE